MELHTKNMKAMEQVAGKLMAMECSAFRERESNGANRWEVHVVVVRLERYFTLAFGYT